jgi:hypothetical protein
MLAAHMRPGQAAVFAQRIDQGLSWLNADGIGTGIYFEGYVSFTGHDGLSFFIY